MKSFFSSFGKSAKELTNVSCLCVTGIFIAVSMVLEMFSIDLTYFKINFAFLAVAVIGMLFGPTVCLFAAMICDIVGFIVHPSGAFLPAYTLVAGVQGLIYGMCLYTKIELPFEKNNDSKHELGVSFFVRAVIARLLDVCIINLILNTKLNMYYGFIPKAAFGVAVKARLAKNIFELAADIPLLFVILPAAYFAYKRMSLGRKTAA